jgi:hypothetical protein
LNKEEKKAISRTNVVELMCNQIVDSLLYVDPFHNELLVVEAFDIALDT